MGCSHSNDGIPNQRKNDDFLSEEEKKRLENFASKTPIRKVFKFEKILGTGGFGIVKLARFRHDL